MAENKRVRPIVLEDARILFRNFSGLEGTFNRAGDRNFCIVLDEEDALRLEEEGWNVKRLTPREEDDVPLPYLPVKVDFSGKYPPRVALITERVVEDDRGEPVIVRGKTDLTERTVNMLDWAEITRVDVSVRPYTWDVQGKTGIKAYLKSLFVTIEMDLLEARYMDVPDSAARTISFKEFDDE